MPLCILASCICVYFSKIEILWGLYDIWCGHALFITCKRKAAHVFNTCCARGRPWGRPWGGENMAYGGLDERTPLCLNIQEEEGATEDSRQQSSLHHRHPAPLRARVTVESQRDAPFHHHGGIHNVLTSSLELSHSGEFVSIEARRIITVCACKSKEFLSGFLV